VVGYGSFTLYVNHKEGLCPSSGDINRLMMMIKILNQYLIVKEINDGNDGWNDIDRY
jgi:hypothetical protein